VCCWIESRFFCRVGILASDMVYCGRHALSRAQATHDDTSSACRYDLGKELKDHNWKKGVERGNLKRQKYEYGKWPGI
jgi:hypothetical protein